MNDPSNTSATGTLAWGVFALALLFLPLGLSLCVRTATTWEPDKKKAERWLRYTCFSRLLMATLVATWWALWDWRRLGEKLLAIFPWLANILDKSSAETFLFWFLPLISLGIYLIFSYKTGATLLRLRWAATDVIRLSWWRLLSFVLPLQMVSKGYTAIFEGGLRGVAWISLAAILSLIATARLRAAEGMKLHEVKGSETRNRALMLARKMGITLRRIYVVPAGRGHLTNAFGGAGVVGLTDNLGKFLNKREIDCVLAHELAHVKNRHGLRKILQTAAIFLGVTLALFLFRRTLTPVRPVVDVLVILFPLGLHYFLSRHYEYEADRESVALTGDAETKIRALVGLYRASDAPARLNRFAELFLTHPGLERRARAIERAARKPDSRVSELLEGA